uniref:FMR1-interacting protein 1 conserved domain-containing protein n=1 Tax=Anopheles culicifacies TaxID=139723 RepID=A0A182MJH6_9DIPT
MAEEQFRLPPPKFKDEVKQGLDSFSRHLNPHFSTPNGMLLTRDKQPPPMYGPRGSTVPPRFLNNPRKRPAGPSWSEHGNNRGMRPGGFQNNYRPRFKHEGGGPNNRSNWTPNNGFDKEVKPELLVLDWKLWCEGCDVNCRSEEEYKQHLANHTPCTVAGCKFVGHPMIMKRHERQMHRDENTAKDAVGPSAEEIEQWKEERRKRYPTKQNVILRQHAQEARFNRGERIEENKDRFPNRNSRTTGDFRENGSRKDMAPNGRKSKRSKGRKRSAMPVADATVQPSTDRIAFRGTSMLKDYKDSSNNALALLGDYGTGSEHETDEEDQTGGMAGKVINESIVQSENVLSEGEIRDDDATNNETNHSPDGLEQPTADDQEQTICTSTDNVPKQATDIISVTSQQTPETSVQAGPSSKQSDRSVAKASKPQSTKLGRNFKDKSGLNTNRPLLDYSKLRRSNQNTMLEKLLDTDIRHERNVLLQCVRHVIVNKFFGIGQSNEAKAAAVSDDVKE